MDITKTTTGIIIGATLTGIALVVVSRFVTDSDIPFLWWLIVAAWFAAYGVVAGGSVGAVVTELELSVLSGAVVGLLLHLLLGFILFILMGGGWDKALYITYYVSLAVGTLNGAIVSLVNSWQLPLR